MEYSNSIDRIVKRNRVNEMLYAAYAHTGKAARVVLVFPSGTAYDVEEMRRIGFADDTTWYICVESNACRRRAMLKRLKQLGVPRRRIVVIDKDLSKLPAADFAKIIEKTGKIEFAFLDYCGEFTYPIARWVNANQSGFADGAFVAVTNKTAFRFTPFATKCLVPFADKYCDVWNKLCHNGNRADCKDYYRPGDTLPRHVVMGYYAAFNDFRFILVNSVEYRNDDCRNNMVLAQFVLDTKYVHRDKSSLYNELTENY